MFSWLFLFHAENFSAPTAKKHFNLSLECYSSVHTGVNRRSAHIATIQPSWVQVWTSTFCKHWGQIAPLSVMRALINIMASNLSKHVMWMHVREQCQQCHRCKQYNRTFTFPDALRLPLMTYTCAWSRIFYQCLPCVHAPSFKTQMRTHMGKMSFKCGQCNYICTHISNLHMHILTHCGESFGLRPVSEIFTW